MNMKSPVILALFVSLLGLSTFVGFPDTLSGQSPVTLYPVKSDISPPLGQIQVINPILRNRDWKNKIVKNRFEFMENVNPTSDYPGSDPVLQREYAQEEGSFAPYVNFDGTTNRNGVAPPDTDGDVGPNHYFQMINSSFTIFNKTGYVLYGPADNSTLWEGFTGPWTGTNDGDPIVMYDHLANRWLATQFAVNTSDNSQWELIAISQTDDPTGAWYRYAYQFTYMPDYPKLGVWPDAYYLSINQFGTAYPYNWIGGGAAAFNRDKMLTGDPAAEMVFFNLGSGVGSLLPSDLDGIIPPAGTPNYFTFFNSSGLHVYEFHADWQNTSNSTITNTANLSVAAFSNSGISVSQKGVTQVLDNLADRLMFRQQYRNFGDYSVLMNNHTVNVGSGRAGIRWYELRNYGSGWSVHQQGTYAPVDDLHRWMASIAMNANGDIALGYSVSGSTLYPSVRFTGRYSGDNAGLMTIAEETIYNGNASQTGVNRWGDYSCMSVDPVNDYSFWFTTEYTTGGWNWKTRIAAFDISTVAPIANFLGSSTITCINQAITLSDLSSGNPTSWQWTFSPATVEFTNGTNETSKNPVVAFLNGGVYSVSLTVSNAQGNNTRTIPDYISVGGINPPVSQNFETTVFPPDGFRIVNPDNSFTWSRNISARGNGSSTAAVYIDFYNYNSRGQFDEIVMPNIDLFNYNAAQLTFNVAYRRYSSSYLDGLNIFISTDCGTSYQTTPIYSKFGSTLATGSDLTSAFVPTAASDWRLETIDLTPYAGMAVTLKFQSVNDYGNNLYLDDIQLTGTLAPLSASFSVTDTTLCAGTQITFTNNSTGPVKTYDWSFSGGSPSGSSDVNPVITYPNPGSYEVKLRISNTQNADSIIRNGYIRVSNPAVINRDPVNLAVHKGDTLQMNISASEALSYQWLQDDEILTGADSQELLIPDISQTHEGWFRCLATNYCNTDTSTRAFADVVYRVEGNLTYSNPSQTPISGTEIAIYQDNNLIMIGLTDETGNFLLDSLQPGNYLLKPVPDAIAGGYNATDALLANLHAVNYPGFEHTGLYAAAADVTNDQNINATDALYILQKTIELIPSFPSGSWVEPEYSLTISNDHIVQNTGLLCYGDINGSFAPDNTKSIGTREIIYGHTLYVDPNDHGFILPLLMTMEEAPGALTLSFSFPSQEFIFENLTSNLDGLLYSSHENIIKLAWVRNQNTETINIAEIFLKFRCRKTPGYPVEVLTLLDNAEVVGAGAVPVSFTLTAPYLSFIPENSVFVLGKNYPNPVTDITSVDFYLSEDGICQFSIYDLAGQQVLQVLDRYVASGMYKVVINAENLPPGIYEYRLELLSIKNFYKSSHKMVVLF